MYKYCYCERCVKKEFIFKKAGGSLSGNIWLDFPFAYVQIIIAVSTHTLISGALTEYELRLGILHLVCIIRIYSSPLFN